MRVLEEFDGDGEISVVLQAVPDCVIVAREGWLVLPVVVLLESLFVLSLHLFIMI